MRHMYSSQAGRMAATHIVSVGGVAGDGLREDDGASSGVDGEEGGRRVVADDAVLHRVERSLQHSA